MRFGTGERVRQRSEFDHFLSDYIKKPVSAPTSRRTSAHNRRANRKRTLFFAFVLLFGLVVTGTLIAWSYPSLGGSARPINRLSAVIIDELSVTDPDPGFFSNATRTLTAAGFHVDVYPPDQATIGFFQSLPTRGYGLVIIRAHVSDDAIATSQLYSKNDFVWSQLTDSLSEQRISNGLFYFSITASFVENHMQGDFQGATVVVMGCKSVTGGSGLGAAFVHRGASAYVGWDDTVSTYYMDLSTSHFLGLIAKGKTVRTAVEMVGATSDPYYQSRLVVVDSSSVAPADLAHTLSLVQRIVVPLTLVFVSEPVVLGLMLKRMWRL